MRPPTIHGLGSDGVTATGLKYVTRRGVLAGTALLAGCQAVPDAAPVIPHLSNDRTGYLLFQAEITPAGLGLFIKDVDALQALNPAAVTIFLNSPGGNLQSAQEMTARVQAMQVRGIQVTMHNVGIVASAACFLFLAADRRRSVPGGRFIFHQASVQATPVSGTVSLTFQQIQDLSTQVQRVERGLTDIITSRTRITPAEATSFTRRTVLLSADEALRDGVIQSIGPATVPKDGGTFVIRAVPATPRPPPSDR